MTRTETQTENVVVSNLLARFGIENVQTQNDRKGGITGFVIPADKPTLDIFELLDRLVLACNMDKAQSKKELAARLKALASLAALEQDFGERMEDMEALAVARALDAGETEAIPASFANRIMDGENPIKVWREYRGLTQRELAARIPVSAGYLSEIENGKKDGSIGVYSTIASILEVDIDDLVD